MTRPMSLNYQTRPDLRVQASGPDPTRPDPRATRGSTPLKIFLLFATLVQVGYTHKLGNKQIRHLFIHFLLYGHIHLTTRLFVNKHISLKLLDKLKIYGNRLTYI